MPKAPKMQSIVIAGSGGQGILTLGKLLAEAGLAEGKQVSWIPSYGPEMRGGTSNCTVIISDEPIGSPVVADPDVVIVFNRPSIEKFLPTVKPGGVCLYDPHEVKEYGGHRSDVTVVAVPATETANRLGLVKIANVVMTGAYLGAAGMVSFDAIMGSLKATLSKRHMDKLPLNEKALLAGMEITKKR